MDSFGRTSRLNDSARRAVRSDRIEDEAVAGIREEAGGRALLDGADGSERSQTICELLWS
jgi:hypothetical protein